LLPCPLPQITYHSSSRAVKTTQVALFWFWCLMIIVFLVDFLTKRRQPTAPDSDPEARPAEATPVSEPASRPRFGLPLSEQASHVRNSLTHRAHRQSLTRPTRYS
jgi:hypothetical protein